ncbi:MAG TPA: dTDP-4-dehydrorhamnose reductase [Gammaproteobacteria bacterium]
MSGAKSANQPTILIAGKNGQVGWELQRSLLPLGRVIAVDRKQMDLSDADSVRKLIQQIKPDVIVNAAAYTAVDKAEEERDLAYQVNALAPGVMAEEARKLGALLIHYSTDYVFNGEKTSPYTEIDQPSPINVYGASKLDGEQAIQSSGCHYLIFRTSWVFSSRGHNFLLSMLRLAKEREELRIVADQIGSPTSARYIADATSHILTRTMPELAAGSFESGLYNVTSASKTSWHGFASAIIDSASGLMAEHTFKVKNIQPITTAEYPVPARRPANSQLSNQRLAERFSISVPEWQVQMELCIADVI